MHFTTKVEKYGICGLPLQLLKSCLSNRTQYTIVYNTKSEICSVCCGVPLGSTLGPLLFLIHTSDMPQGSKLCTRLFADDIVLTLSNNCERELNHLVNLKTVKIDLWMKINKLSLNYIKTKFMLFLSQSVFNILIF